MSCNTGLFLLCTCWQVVSAVLWDFDLAVLTFQPKFGSKSRTMCTHLSKKVCRFQSRQCQLFQNESGWEDGSLRIVGNSLCVLCSCIRVALPFLGRPMCYVNMYVWIFPNFITSCILFQFPSLLCLQHVHCLLYALGVPLESTLNRVRGMSPCGRVSLSWLCSK